MKAQKVIIEKILECSNEKQRILQVASEEDVKVGNGAHFFQKVDAFKKRRVAFRPIHVDKLTESEIKVGDDIGEKLGAEFAIQTTESMEPSYEGQSPKIDPSTEEVLLKDGSPIYIKNELVLAEGAEDTLIQYNGRTSIDVEKEEGELA